MSWSLRVSNGDLVLDGTKFATVNNENKLVQDFRHFILERMGTDLDHPWYGSLLDGGTKPTGQQVESVIAGTDWPTIQIRLEADLRRIAAQYQNMQLDRAKRDRARYNRSTLTLGEVLAAITEITFSQQADALYVTIFIESGREISTAVDLQLAPVITR